MKSLISIVQGWVRLRGGTDGSILGNDGDTLKTTGAIKDPITGFTAKINSLRQIESTASVGDVTFGDVIVGEDQFPDTWFQITTFGLATDQVTIEVDDLSLSKVITLTGATDIFTAAQVIVDALLGDSNWTDVFDITKVEDNAIVHLLSHKRAEAATHADANDFEVSVTLGTTTIFLPTGFDTIIRRPKKTMLSRSRKDRRIGLLGFEGDVTTRESGRPPKVFNLQTSASSEDMRVDGSGTDVVFKLSNDSTFDTSRNFTVTQLRLFATAGSIQIGKFIEVPALTVGMLVQIRSKGELSFQENLKLVDNIHHKFSIGKDAKFDPIFGAGDASLVATIEAPFDIIKTGIHATDDDIIATIRDDLNNASIKILGMDVIGFYEEI